MAPPLPAHETKHVPSLDYPFKASSFRLAQRDNGDSNGTALWLGAQCLSLFLADLYASNHSHGPKTAIRPRAIELGSGIGLTALALASMGWDVLATDLPVVIDSVLARNIAQNLSSLPPEGGNIEVRTLDWSVLPEHWVWSHPCRVAVAHASEAGLQSSPETDLSLLSPPFDLIVSADTVYSPTLIAPLLRTLHALASLSPAAPQLTHAAPVYLCLERRDPALAERTLIEAKDLWNFTTERIPHKKIHRALKKAGVSWDASDWEGVEIWKLTLRLRQ